MTTKHPRKTSLGKLAAGALVAVGMVAAAGSSAMSDSWKHNNGHGNGDQDAPGNSLDHNNAENSEHEGQGNSGNNGGNGNNH